MTGADVTGNRLLAARALDVADKAMTRRRAALAVHVALTETTTIPAARKILDGLPGIGQGGLHAAATQILSQLAREPEE